MRCGLTAASSRVLAVAIMASSVSGCGAVGVVGTAANVTYEATKTTVKAAGGAVKWAYRGVRNVAHKVSGHDDDEDAGSQTAQQDENHDSVHTGSTSTVRLPEVVKRQ